MRRKLIAGMVMCTVMGTSVGVMAGGTIKDISAKINSNLSMTVNGENFAPTDAEGTIIRPITYNDSTYLPVRALGEALGVEVDYDEETGTVILGKAIEEDEGIDTTDIVPDTDEYEEDEEIDEDNPVLEDELEVDEDSEDEDSVEESTNDIGDPADDAEDTEIEDEDDISPSM